MLLFISLFCGCSLVCFVVVHEFVLFLCMSSFLPILLFISFFFLFCCCSSVYVVIN